MGSQRFCLRWNNHQTNLLSVFDQLLHDEAFVDVTLAVEGQFLRAHKMVLSACSPYFQALFVGHPDKHPIVILKDVPYSDMRSLLDFMYRGEVSVDQDRLTAFLKVAESLRIKGLTEVNEERCDLPSIANSLLNQTFTSPPPPPPPTPTLHRLPMSGTPPNHQPKPVRPPPTPMLNSALTAPKRKRGRPRKLSGSSPNPTPLSHSDMEQDEPKPILSAPPVENHLGVQYSSPPVQQHSQSNANLPLSQEIPVTSFKSCLPSVPNSNIACNNTLSGNHNAVGGTMSSMEELDSPKVEEDDEDDCEDLTKMEDCEDEGALDEEDPPDPQTNHTLKTEEPKPSTSGQDSLASFQSSTQSDGEKFSSSGIEMDSGMLRLVPRSGLMNFAVKGDIESDDNDDSLVVDAENNNDSGDIVDDDEKMDFTEPPRPVASKRRVRRRTASSCDPAEALTEMSVRGLNLFRYASISDGIYKCMECAKADVLKTFKNKYSFQRHAFLYHEGHQRKVFPCPVCAKEFSRPDKMKNHMKMVHECFIPKECMFPAVGYYLPQ